MGATHIPSRQQGYDRSTLELETQSTDVIMITSLVPWDAEAKYIHVNLDQHTVSTSRT